MELKTQGFFPENSTNLQKFNFSETFKLLKNVQKLTLPPQPMCRFHVVITQKQAKGFFLESQSIRKQSSQNGVLAIRQVFLTLYEKIQAKNNSKFQKNNSRFLKNSA